MYHLANEKLYEYPQTLPVFDVANFPRKTLSMCYRIMKCPNTYTLTKLKLIYFLDAVPIYSKRRRKKINRKKINAESQQRDRQRKRERTYFRTSDAKQMIPKKERKKKSKNKDNQYIRYRAMISLSESAANEKHSYGQSYDVIYAQSV